MSNFDTPSQARGALKAARKVTWLYADDMLRGNHPTMLSASKAREIGASQRFDGWGADEYTLTVYLHSARHGARAVAVVTRVYSGEYNTLGADLAHADWLDQYQRKRAIMSPNQHQRNVEIIQRDMRFWRLCPRAFADYANGV